MTVRRSADLLTIEVRDGDPTAPRPPTALEDRHHRARPADPRRPDGAMGLPSRRARQGRVVRLRPGGGVMNTEAPRVRVRLVDLPVEVHRRSSEHREALRRELAFIEHAQAPDAVPARLHALTSELTARYGAARRGAEQPIAGRRGGRRGAHRRSRSSSRPTSWTPPPTSARCSTSWTTSAERGICSPSSRRRTCGRYRLWILEELTAQIREGRAPRPWPGHRAGPRHPRCLDGRGARRSSLRRRRPRPGHDLRRPPARSSTTSSRAPPTSPSTCPGATSSTPPG